MNIKFVVYHARGVKMSSTWLNCSGLHFNL